MFEKLSIRPALKSGEALSSYLIRVAKANYISFKQLTSLVSDHKRIYERHASLIDKYPENHLNLELLAKYLGKSLIDLENMTLTYVVKKFMEDIKFDSTKLFQIGVNYLYERDHRRFCPLCLKEKGYYKLLWQIKEIDICIEHNIPLQSSCNKCGAEQLYLKESLGDFNCFNCGGTLIDPPEKIYDKNLVKLNHRYYKDWGYILNKNSKLSVCPNGIEKDLALKILYLTQPIDDKFILNETKIISVSTSSKYKNLIINKKQSKRVSIQMLFAVIRQLDIDIENFHLIEVPQKFINLVNNDDVEDKTNRFCLSPWCKYYKKEKKNNMKRLDIKFLTSHGIRYNQPSICLGCNLRHGFNDSTGNWDVEQNIELIKKVKGLLPLRKNKTNIIERDKISARLLKKILGYIANYKLVPSDVLEQFVPNFEEKDVLNCFKEMAVANQNGSYDGLNRASLNMFGWSQMEFYYYFWNDNIQEYLNFEFYPSLSRNYQRKKEANSNANVIVETKKILSRLMKLDVDITITSVANELGFGKTKCISLGLHPFIKEGKEEQVRLRKARTGILIAEKVKLFINIKSIENKPILAEEVYKYLGLSSSILRRDHEELYEIIISKANESKENYKQRKLIEYKSRIFNSMLLLYDSQLPITYKNICLYSGISISIINNYSELKDYVANVKQQLGSGRV